MDKTDIRVLEMGLYKEEVNKILCKSLNVSWIPGLDLFEQQSK